MQAYIKKQGQLAAECCCVYQTVVHGNKNGIQWGMGLNF
jgi:hypothetical protein